PSWAALLGRVRDSGAAACQRTRRVQRFPASNCPRPLQCCRNYSRKATRPTRPQRREPSHEPLRASSTHPRKASAELAGSTIHENPLHAKVHNEAPTNCPRHARAEHRTSSVRTLVYAGEATDTDTGKYRHTQRRPPG